MISAVNFYKDDGSNPTSIMVNMEHNECNQYIINTLSQVKPLVFSSNGVNGIDTIIVPYHFYHDKLIKIIDSNDPFEQY